MKNGSAVDEEPHHRSPVLFVPTDAILSAERFLEHERQVARQSFDQVTFNACSEVESFVLLHTPCIQSSIIHEYRDSTACFWQAQP